jgi:hypothetical protein
MRMTELQAVYSLYKHKHGIINLINIHFAAVFGYAEATIAQIIQPNVDTRNFRIFFLLRYWIS